MAFEKEVKFGPQARQPILNGAEKAAKAVRATLGPLGRNVAIRVGEKRPPVVTKDGVTVAKAMQSFPDFYEDMGLQMVKEAASRTNDAAADGTTTASLLTFEFMKNGLEKMQDGVNAIHIRRGMQIAERKVNENLNALTIIDNSPEKLKSIATISSQDENIGDLISLVMQEIGEDGAVTVEPAMSLGIGYTLTEGMQLSSGYSSPHFINKKDKQVSVLKDTYVLVYDERITDVMQIVGIIDMVNKENGRLVIIAESVEHEALHTLIVNLPWVQMQGKNAQNSVDFESIAIRAPEVGERRNEILQDIAIKTGARLISKKVGLTLKNITLADLGRAEQVVCTAKTTTIINGAGDDESVQGRTAEIKQLIEQTQDEDEKDFLKGRLANMNGRIAVITVGAPSEVEQKEIQHRVEDAIGAVRASMEEGIVPGGGTALIACTPKLEELELKTEGERIGAQIVIDTLSKPLWWIAENAGYDGDDVVSRVKAEKQGVGFNAETGEYVDMIANNIIDPKKVSRCALENAISVAAAFLTLEVGITDIQPMTAPKEEAKAEKQYIYVENPVSGNWIQRVAKAIFNI